MNEASTEPVPITMVGQIIHGSQDLFRSHNVFRREPSEEALTAVGELFPPENQASEFVWRFGSLMVLSSLIAAFGLLADSSAVVIGAMLVAPLMTPILAASASLVRAENQKLAWAMMVIAVGTVLAVFVGWAVSLVASQSLGEVLDLPTEVRSRTLPGLLDLGVAVSAGATAGYVLPRRSALSALPGVGVAVALVPPLTAAGISWELGLGEQARGAMLLYVTNLAAITFAASVMLIFVGFRPVRNARRSLAARLTVTALIIALIAIPLSVHTGSVYAENELRSLVVKAIPEWDATVEATTVDAQIVDGAARIEVQVVGPNDPLPSWRLAEVIGEQFEGPVELVLLYDQIRQFEVSSR